MAQEANAETRRLAAMMQTDIVGYSAATWGSPMNDHSG